MQRATSLAHRGGGRHQSPALSLMLTHRRRTGPHGGCRPGAGTAIGGTSDGMYLAEPAPALGRSSLRHKLKCGGRLGSIMGLVHVRDEHDVVAARRRALAQARRPPARRHRSRARRARHPRLTIRIRMYSPPHARETSHATTDTDDEFGRPLPPPEVPGTITTGTASVKHERGLSDDPVSLLLLVVGDVVCCLFVFAPPIRVRMRRFTGDFRWRSQSCRDI